MIFTFKIKFRSSLNSENPAVSCDMNCANRHALKKWSECDHMFPQFDVEERILTFEMLDDVLEMSQCLHKVK